MFPSAGHSQRLSAVEEAISAARRAGNSADSTSPLGMPGTSLPPIPPRPLARITGLQNYDSTDTTKLPCYSFDLVRERDATLPSDPSITQQAIIQDYDGYAEWRGDFSAMDPTASAPSTYLPAAYELSGNIQVPTDGSAIVEIWRVPGCRQFFFKWDSEGQSGGLFPVTANDRQEISGTYTYGWIGIDDSSLTGTLPAIAVLSQTQTHDGLNSDEYSLYIKGGTGGTFTLTDSGGSPTGGIAYNASAATVQAALTNFTVTGSGTSGSPWILTGTAGTNTGTGTGNTLTVDGTNLLPPVSHSPFTFLNNTPMDVPVNVWLKLKSGADPDLDVITKQTGNGTVPAIFKITLADLVDGTFKGTFDGGTASAAIPWNPTVSQVQAALTAILACTVTGTDHTGPFTVTVTADNLPHTLTLDDSGLFGTKVYREVWSNGNACTGPVGGVYPPSIPGFTGKGIETYSGRTLTISVVPTPTITISPSGSSAGPWTLSGLLGATGGTYQITVDGGSPVSTSFSLCPTLSGFTTSGSVGSCILTASSGSHTLLAFGALLTADQPRQYLTIDSTLCADLIAPRRC